MALAWAVAADAPETVAARLVGGVGDVIVTDARGVIVGVGRIVAGVSFELRFLDDFVGPARLTLLRSDGSAEALDVVVDGRVMVEGLDLLELLDERLDAFTVEVGGVEHQAGERRAGGSGAAGGGGQRPDAPPGNAGSPGPPAAPGGPGSLPPRGPAGRP